MKKIITSTLMLSLLCLQSIATTPLTVPGKFKIDAKLSAIKWTGKKVLGEHTGNVSVKNGERTLKDNQIASAKIDVDMNSITCSDISDSKTNAYLVNHLKADDFFGTDKFPTASFVLDKITPIKGAKAGENNYTAKGKLIIKGISKPIEFPALIETRDKLVKIVADVRFDRTDYGIKFKSASVFTDLGDKAILDEVLFSVALVGNAE